MKRKINAEHKPDPNAEPPADPKKKAKPAKEPKPAKPGKPAKAAKPPKGPEYITKDQFIAACNADEQIKQLFVDSIFCGGSDAGLSFTMPEVHAADLSISAPTVTVNTRSAVTVDGVTVEETATTSTNDANVLKFEMPSVTVNADKVEAPSVELNAEAPAVSVSAEAPAVEVSAEAPAVEVNFTAPSVEVKEAEAAN